MAYSEKDYVVELERHPGAAQHEETFIVRRPDGSEQRIRLHDYDLVYPIPGLYEEVVQRQLECASPRKIVESLVAATADAGLAPSAIRVLDLGAGNGVIGEQLRDAGIATPVASDALVEARDAAARDRPGLYAEYLVDDGGPEAYDALTAAIAQHELNALTCAAALGPDHIPLERLVGLWSAFPAGSFVALTASSALIADEWGGAAGVLERLSGIDATTELVHSERFRHRLLMDGGSVDYDVIVGRKPGA
jgi:hypothetical protein